MNSSHQQYQQLSELSRRCAILKGVSSLLDWDQETYMPPNASANRAEQLKVMAGVIHREQTSPKFKESLASLIDLQSGTIFAKNLSDEQKAALREWRKDYLQLTALPSSFVEELAELQSQSIHAWRYAKKESAFHQFAPFLDRLVQMNRRKADLLGYEDHPYDALLNEYEPDMTTRQVTKLFHQIQSPLTTLLNKICQQPVEDQFLFGKWDHAKQMEFAHLLLDAMGYDKNHGRLDLTSHPFSSSSHPTDSRITSRIHPSSLMSHILAVLHEGGHSLYEMGLPVDLFGTPLCEARSLGIHESQSRWWETRIGLSQPFWSHFFPILQSTFPGQLSSIDLPAFYRAINRVKPSLIRIEADEVTYPLHVVLRFELEKALIEGSLTVRELPEAWNAKMEAYLAIKPQNIATGCLQDIHWAMGAFGYFPTYALGNLYAAHLFEAFEKQEPSWQARVAKGELAFIKKWLQEKIYQHGRRFETLELLKLATGKEFSEKAYLDYIQQKYSHIYSL